MPLPYHNFRFTLGVGEASSLATLCASKSTRRRYLAELWRARPELHRSPTSTASGFYRYNKKFVFAILLSYWFIKRWLQ